MKAKFVDARSAVIGGIAAAGVALVGLTGFHPELMTALAVSVFGTALHIQGRYTPVRIRSRTNRGVGGGRGGR